MKALFITEKNISPDRPDLGLTNSMSNLIGSWECSGLGEYKHLFLHPEEIWSSQAVDHALLNYEYDLAVLSPWYNVTCSIEVVEKIQSHLVIVWWDLIPLDYGNPHLADHQKWWRYGEAGALNVVLDHGTGNFDKQGYDIIHKNTVAFETPQDTRIFKKENIEEDIDVSFVGAISGERQSVINKLQDAGIKVWYGGGRFNGNLSTEEYAAIHKRSKICLNIQGGLSTVARKGRGFEIAACGKFMLANHTHTLKGYFEEGTDYVGFDTNNVVEKVKYYLHHTEERIKIAESLHKKYQERFTPKHFWKRIIKLLTKGAFL